MKQKCFKSYGLIDTAASTRRAVVLGGCLQSTTSSNNRIWQPFPAGTFRKLRAVLDGDPGAGNSVTITLYNQTTATSLTVTLDSANYTGASDTTHEVSINEGDQVLYYVVTSGTPNSVALMLMIEFEPSTANRCVLSSSGGGNALGAGTAALYYTPFGGAIPSSTETYKPCIMPFAGTIVGFIAYLSAAPGGTATRAATVRLAQGTGAYADTELSVTYGSADTGNKTDTGSVSFSAGDRINVQWSVGGSGAPVSGYAAVCLIIQPDTDGDFVIPAESGSTQLSASGTRYTAINSNIPPSSNEALTVACALFDDFTLKGTYGWLDFVPGSGKSYTVTLRKDIGDASPTYQLVFSDSNQGPVSAAADLVPTQWSLYNAKVVPSGTPTAARLSQSFRATMVAAGGGISIPVVMLQMDQYGGGTCNW